VIIEYASCAFVTLTKRISISFLVVLEICCMRADWKDDNNFRAKIIIVVISLSKGYMRDYILCCLCAWLCWFILAYALLTILSLLYLCCLCWFLICVGLSCSICAIFYLVGCHECQFGMIKIIKGIKLYDLISGGSKVNKCGNNLFWELYAQNKPWRVIISKRIQRMNWSKPSGPKGWFG
jgi:hypothetical protein